MKPVALIIRTAGTNCDRELAHAFELAGADPVTVHLNKLIEEPTQIERAGLIGVPGGFSYGDDIAAGRILANRLRHRLLGPLRVAIERGAAVIGICNGFQVLVKLGLLPDPTGEGEATEASQTVTLTDNTRGRFVAKWVGLEVPTDTVCVWTRGLGRFDLPIAHGEGRFVTASQQVLEQFDFNGQVALRYASSDLLGLGEDGVSGLGFNPNGSVGDIAGICDPSGRVLGLMPHPERYTDLTHHPLWTRTVAPTRAGEASAGLKLFHNAVEYARQLSCKHSNGRA